MTDQWTIDRDLGEALQDNEKQLSQQIAAVIREQITREFELAKQQGAEALARRDAHPRAHGCVKAEFQVEAALPVELAQGVFVRGATYPAWVRFSNGFPDPSQPDAKGDIRGMAVKLLNVPGDKILPDERDAETQDFIMASQPAFFADDAARYLKFTRATTDPFLVGKLVKIYLALDFAGFKNLLAVGRQTIASPLQARYWSQVPYRLGDAPHKQAIKFSAVPHLPQSAAVPANATAHYLRETMARQLAANEARFDFMVQRRAPAMSVERSVIEWKEQDAKFERVATIKIPRQEFATEARDEFGENLSFTPWHALPLHRPLGAVNRMRRVIYQIISEQRHKLNNKPRREPRASDQDGIGG
jgi:hypothetical protein